MIASREVWNLENKKNVCELVRLYKSVYLQPGLSMPHFNSRWRLQSLFLDWISKNFVVVLGEMIYQRNITCNWYMTWVGSQYNTRSDWLILGIILP